MSPRRTEARCNEYLRNKERNDDKNCLPEVRELLIAFLGIDGAVLHGLAEVSGFVDPTSANHGFFDRDRDQARRILAQRIAAEHDEVRQFSGLDRSFEVFLEGSVGTVQCRDSQCLLHGDSLAWSPGFFR